MVNSTAEIIDSKHDFNFSGESVINSRIIPEQVDFRVEDQTRQLRQKINELPDTFIGNQNCRYISSFGSAENDGTSPESAWDSLETLEKNRALLKPGETVLFRRGDIFRGCITAVSGVSYGAYGIGEKPRIYGSSRDYIKDSWHEISDGLWTVDADFPADVGNIIFDNGCAVGCKRIHKKDLVNLFDYWCDHDNGNRIYIRLDRHPAERFKSIEIAHNLWLFRLDNNTRDVKIENLDFRYCGGHGIRSSNVQNVSISGCEFSFIGGSFLTGFKDGCVRYGNAVEFIAGCKNSVVKNCIAYQIYDSGITHQGYGDYRAENIVFAENLLEYCGMGSIEYWLGDGSKCINITYKDNIMRFVGYGFGGMQRPDKEMSAHIQSNGACLNESENFIIENNIFELSTYDLINAQSSMNTVPVLKGNTYIQNKNGRLGSYSGYLNCDFTGDLQSTIGGLWQDKNAKIRML